MNIVFSSSEAYPFAKTGGLGDVCGWLPLALAKLGHKVKLFLPWYKVEPQKHYDSFGISSYRNIDIVFVKNDYFFKRDHLYGDSEKDYPDNLERFSYFCRSIFKILKEISFSPDIIHSHDWQTALVPVYLNIFHRDDYFFENTKTVLTIHNLFFQGIFEKEHFQYLNIPWDYFNMHYLEFYGKINLLKAGIIFSDALTTVSPTYAKQIQESELGCGLEGVLKEKKAKLTGILNGIDYDVWDPKNDEFIYQKYSTSLELKGKNKLALQKEVKFEQNREILLFGMVCRLTEQKGMDILLEAIEFILKDAQLIILGIGQKIYQQKLQEKQKQNKGNFYLSLDFNEALAHKIYAASDAFLLPSRFEPCGLSQMISFKYGALPVFYLSGGMADVAGSKKSGFAFDSYTKKGFIAALSQAKQAFNDKPGWQKVVKENFKKDFSWDKPAKLYHQLYLKTKKAC